jgi:hypothetical protein
MQEYIDRLLSQLDGQTRLADRIFPSPTLAMTTFVKKVFETVLQEYFYLLIDRTRQGAETDIYLKAVVGTYHQCRRLVQYLNKPKSATGYFRAGLFEFVDDLFKPHIEPYLRVELDYYKSSCDTVVDDWNKKVPFSRLN